MLLLKEKRRCARNNNFTSSFVHMQKDNAAAAQKAEPPMRDFGD